MSSIESFHADVLMVNEGDAVAILEPGDGYVFATFVYARTGRDLMKLHNEVKTRYNSPIRFRTRQVSKVKNHAKLLYGDTWEST